MPKLIISLLHIEERHEENRKDFIQMQLEYHLEYVHQLLSNFVTD